MHGLDIFYSPDVKISEFLFIFAFSFFIENLPINLTITNF